MKKVLLSAALAAAALVSAPAHAYYVTFDYVVPTDGSGKTSALVGTSNQNIPSAPVFVETFDTGKNQDGSSICGVNTPGAFASLSGTMGVNWDLSNATVPNVGAEPAGDTTCFAYGPAANTPVSPANPDTLTVTYSSFFINNVMGGQITNFGLYYGSIDDYNNITFHTSGGDILITGASLLALFNGQSGNQGADSSNIYVNIHFDKPGEQFTGFTFSTTGVAFEMDNLVVANLPEPASLALIGAGLAALGLSRRRKQQKA